MRSLFSFPLGLPRSGVFPPSLASFLSALAFPPGLGLSRAPPPGLSGFLEVGRFSWGWGTGLVWEIWGIGVKVGEKVVSGCKGLKKRFLHLCQSVCLSLSSSFSVCLFLSPSLVKVGEVAGKEQGTLRLSAFGASQFLHKAESPSPGQWPGCLGMKTPASLPWLGQGVAGPQEQVICFSGVPTTSSQRTSLRATTPTLLYFLQLERREGVREEGGGKKSPEKEGGHVD